MPSDIRIYVIMIAIGGALIFAVSFVPPLTTGGLALAPGVTQEDFDDAVARELKHCQSLDADLDCQCYADVSGYVLAQETAPIPFTRSMDQTELARRQAAPRC
ncbi:hypothetical protein [uncultured Tateyamaria sp.]|uniref:hypothetical protein n=1 Tax=uncultured Tateyamaria sp. TaxID=455651 RepID=UPI002637E384|nr:hypothetical protein [uncultured Tateyamaria sp.]